MPFWIHEIELHLVAIDHCTQLNLPRLQEAAAKLIVRRAGL